MQPPTFAFTFTDNQTESIPWSPALGSFNATLQMGNRQGLTVWDLTFKSDIEPADDSGDPATGPDTVFPYWMQLIEDASANHLDGVMMIDDLAPKGTLVGVRGTRQNALITGYYLFQPQAAPVGIFAGRLVADGKPIARSWLEGNTLYWNALPVEIQQRCGLPATGQATFNSDGSIANVLNGSSSLRRLSASMAITSLAAHQDIHPALNVRHGDTLKSLLASPLDIYGLLSMNPFAQNDSGQWGDAVQNAVTNDLNSIMNSFIPSKMWQLLFPSTPQQPLSGELAVVANSPVSGVADPSAWYQSLATAVMTSGMSGGSDKNCANMNGARADQWLKAQTGTSPVYYTHSQLLFKNEWQKRFPLIGQYLSDQVTNALLYQPQIDAQIQFSINDINTNVVADSTDPNMKENLIAQVKTVGDYARAQKLYWAFAFFTYNTTPAILANIGLQMGINTGSSDGTTLSRLFQQNVSTLTALDPSGYFAKQYISTINIFMATNILPSMFGFTGDADNFDMIKQYLQYFVDKNLANEDQQIAQAAAQIKSILDDAEADKILHDSINALRGLSGAIRDTLALPFVANRFVKWFSTNYPRLNTVANLFGSILIGGITGLAVFNLFSQFKQWDKLSPSQKAQVIVDASQVGLQIVAAVVKRGVRIYSIYGVEGMTTCQRTAAISKIVVIGEDSILDQSLVRIGNSAARWLADTEGTMGKIAVMNEGAVTAVLVNSAETVMEEAGWVGKILGRNLEEFIATRIGPIFILAGIGFSLYSLIKGEKGIALATDVINIISGSLMLFATIGEWAISGGFIAGEGVLAGLISAAGPLAILLALAGIALMIYEMTRTPPDPVKEFVDTYVRPAGFYISSRASSIDYVTQYANVDQQNLLMIGFTLGINGKLLSVGNDRSISIISAASSLPDSVWQVTTDGYGLSQILTAIQPDPTAPPVVAYLSLMSDNSLSFQPKWVPASSTTANTDGVTVVTQTWLSTPQGDARLTSDNKYLAALNLTLRSVIPDSQGNYVPANASGYIISTPTGVGYSASTGSTFTLTVSGMKPNYMRMMDVAFLVDTTPSQQQTYGAAFGVYPSTPMAYTLSPAPAAFLTFSTQTGQLAPNGGVATPASSTIYTLGASNTLGSEAASFTLSVAPPPPVPAAVTQAPVSIVSVM
ncbi:hypothetical protein [Pantoea sp. At-9b]|uniref:hypothetical protein n=1 Tax=Pantoea sp. (strain At-9b) TaxID=592316 RepID=UPI00167F4B0F|nr:hypothetical protein [Pantoea sp. At-9b]